MSQPRKLYVLAGLVQLTVVDVHAEEASSLRGHSRQSDRAATAVVRFGGGHVIKGTGQRETSAGVAPTVCSCAASVRMVPTPHIGSTTQKPGWGSAHDTGCV